MEESTKELGCCCQGHWTLPEAAWTIPPATALDSDTQVAAVGEGRKSERRSKVEVDGQPTAAAGWGAKGGGGTAKVTDAPPAMDPQQNCSRPASGPPAVEGVEATPWKTAAGVRSRGGICSNRSSSGAKLLGTVLGGVTTETVFSGEP